MRISFATALVAFVLLVQPLGAIELSQDFDSGSLNVAASTVVGNTVNLVGRRTWTDPTYRYRYRWVYFKASDVAGLQPQFTISAGSFLGDLSDHRYLYSYNQTEWSYFDNCYVSGGTYYFRNHQPFTGNDVYVAYSLPYPVSRTQAHVAAVTQSPFVSPTISGAGGYVVGHTAGGVDNIDVPERIIAPQDIYGFKISDPAGPAEKSKVLLSSGVHSCETPGNHALEGMIDFLLSDAPQAVCLRRMAEFYVYPQVNPDGRLAGYYRSTPENPSKDYNRFWNNPAGFTDMTAARNAMILDTGGDVDYLLDFHSMFGAWSRAPYFETIPSDANSPFVLALAELEPGIYCSKTYGTAGMLRIWGQSASGLKAEHSYTPEFGCHPGVLEDRLDQMGASYAKALFRALWSESTFVAGDATADGLVDAADAAVLADCWGFEDADWSMGDFDGDGRIGPSDASILAANWGNTFESLATAVPEPATPALVGTLPLIWLLRRRRLLLARNLA
ncbi:MAG: hypothetical protein JW719_04550 [Pirellulales bacterium]|nr:hypothetical protein [Pirellulales bacterium]